MAPKKLKRKAGTSPQTVRPLPQKARTLPAKQRTLAEILEEDEEDLKATDEVATSSSSHLQCGGCHNSPSTCGCDWVAYEVKMAGACASTAGKDSRVPVEDCICVFADYNK